jgi:transcriptional activator of cad operon
MPSGDSEGALQIGDWIVNPSLDSISKGTETQKLEPRTMRLLLCLAGYRLIAAVRRLQIPGESAPSADALPAADAPSQPVRRSTKRPLFLVGALLIALIAVGAMIWKKTSTGKLLSTANSIVVLPFIDMTAEKSDQSFCDGLTEELSNWLAQIPTLRVVARTSAFAFNVVIDTERSYSNNSLRIG